MLKSGSLANIISAESWRKKHIKTTKQSEEKANDFIDFFKMLKNI